MHTDDVTSLITHFFFSIFLLSSSYNINVRLGFLSAPTTVIHLKKKGYFNPGLGKNG